MEKLGTLVFAYVAVHGLMEALYMLCCGKKYLGMLHGLAGKKTGVNVWAGVASYAVLFCATWYVVFLQVYNNKGKHAWDAVLLGALFGLCVYGVYNFTNAFAFPNYDWMLATTDVAYGVVSIGLIGLFAWWLRIRNS